MQLLERLDERVEPAPAAPDALPRGQEARERRGVDRLDLVAQRRERPAPQHAQHVRVAPLALDAARPELAVHDAFLGFEPRRARSRARSTVTPSRPATSSTVNGPCVRA